jgi:filamentous hemagglutinin family protein
MGAARAISSLTLSRNVSSSLVLCLTAILLSTPSPPTSFAQSPPQPHITLDGTLQRLGGSGYQEFTDLNVTISESMGVLRGSSLIHSFGRLNVPDGGSLTFTGDSPGIANVLSRVTGGEVSLILGQLSSSIPGAHLFLMNPAGIVFGPNATLNVAGSVTATTADYIRLFDEKNLVNTYFYANPVKDNLTASNSVLVSSPISEFGFLTPAAVGFLNSPDQAASVTVQGSILSVPDGQSLTVVGGEVKIQSGTLDDETPQSALLSAPGGRVNLASAKSTGEVLIPTLQAAPNVNGQLLTAYGDVTLSEGTFIDVSGESAGAISIRAGRFELNNSFLVSSTAGDASGELIAVLVKADGDAFVKNGSFVVSQSDGAAKAGDIIVEAFNLHLTEGSTILARSSGSAPTGNVTINTSDMLSLSGTNAASESGSRIASESLGACACSERSGDVDISAKSASMDNQALIETIGGGDHPAGNIALDVTSLTVKGASLVQTIGGDDASSGNIYVKAKENISLIGQFDNDSPSGILNRNEGNGGTGKILIDTGSLALENVAWVRSSTFRGAADISEPKISITARDAQDSITVSGGSSIRVLSNLSDVGALDITGRDVIVKDQGFISTETFGPGKAGPLTLHADNLTVANGGQLISSTFSSTGQGGNMIIVLKDTLSLTGQFHDMFGQITPSSLSVRSTGAGSAGQLSISARAIDISDGARIDSSTSGGGLGGTIMLASSDSIVMTSGASVSASSTGTGNAGSITINAAGNFESSGGTVSTTATQAQGGDINITAGQDIQLTNNASVSASSTGAGNAGNITAIAGDDFIMQNSSVTTQATQASGGNIKIGAADQILIRNSLISASVMGGGGSGGNISIDPTAVILQNSQILARAVLGSGGNISIVTPFFLADQASVISASSQFGLNGTVTIQSPTSNLSGSLGTLASKPSQAQSLVTQRCAALVNGQASSFVVAGREQLPADPGSWLSSPIALAGIDAERFGDGTVAADTSNLELRTSNLLVTDRVSLRRLTPARFLMANFADSEAAECHS